jgi:putative SOS response-associated peptidase YedK
MCGRFTNNAKPEQIKKEFKTDFNNSFLVEPKYNIAPSQSIDVVFEPEGERVITKLKWGLVPSWSKDATTAKGLINARAETLTEKPSFREAFKKRRCIIPTSGFYEWKREEKGAKQPFYFYLNNRELFGFAGLWEEWLDKQTGELLETCTIITTAANAVLKPIHDRMPVILKTDDYDEWLNWQTKDIDKLQSLLRPYPAADISCHAVSRSVNTPDTNSPELILPLNSL